MRLCIIPARGGSKRIPRKNIRAFCGEPIISYPIKAALESGVFDRVIVSTDDEEILAVAQSAGAEVPFIRPDELSDDFAATQPVIAHAIQAVGLAADATVPVCCLYATAPFVEAQDLQSAIGKLETLDTDAFVMAVTTFAFPIQRGLRRDAIGQLSMFQPENMFTRSQDLEEAWHDAGQFYACSAASWCSEKPLLERKSFGIELPRKRVQDIDTEEDWQLAELLFQAQREIS